MLILSSTILQVLVQVHYSLYKESITTFSQHLTTKIAISPSCGVSMYVTLHGKNDLPHDVQLVSVYKHLDFQCIDNFGDEFADRAKFKQSVLYTQCTLSYSFDFYRALSKSHHFHSVSSKDQWLVINILILVWIIIFLFSFTGYRLPWR